jgi:homopolymeric O-antigen transport system permease protein
MLWGMVSKSAAREAGLASESVLPADSHDSAQSAKVVRFEGGSGWAAGLPDLWVYREVLYFMLVRNLKIRFRQALLGAAWAVIQPLALMGVLVFVAHVVFKAPSQGVPYPLFAFAGLVPWTLFSQSVTVAAESIVRDMNLVSKVYIPRLIIPLAAIGVLIVDFLIAFGIVLILMALYSWPPGLASLAWVPATTLLALTVSVGVGVWLSALMVLYRDVRWVVPLLVQVWLFATPVAYSASLVPEHWQLLYYVNPMAGVVEGFRSGLLGTETPAAGLFAVSGAVGVSLLVGAFAYFRRVDRIFADVI